MKGCICCPVSPVVWKKVYHILKKHQLSEKSEHPKIWVCLCNNTPMVVSPCSETSIVIINYNNYLPPTYFSIFLTCLLKCCQQVEVQGDRTDGWWVTESSLCWCQGEERDSRLKCVSVCRCEWTVRNSAAGGLFSTNETTNFWGIKPITGTRRGEQMWKCEKKSRKRVSAY